MELELDSVDSLKVTECKDDSGIIFVVIYGHEFPDEEQHIVRLALTREEAAGLSNRLLAPDGIET